jgi:IclR family pca regulon transcriptional regulator
MFTSRYKVEALAHGLEILSLFTTERPSLNLTEIIIATQLTKSKTFRMVSTLELLGYLERDPVTRSYRPGLKVLQLGFTALNSLELAQIAQPYLKSLSDATGETTNMAIRDGAEIVYVARNITQRIISVNLYRGSRLPVYCTALGKSLLIDLSQKEILTLLGEGPYPKMGPNSITNINDLMSELEQIRQKGYAMNDEELAVGLRSVAAPIRGSGGNIVAAINISMPGSRISIQKLEADLAPKVMDTVWKISSALGAGSHLTQKDTHGLDTS